MSKVEVSGRVPPQETGSKIPNWETYLQLQKDIREGGIPLGVLALIDRQRDPNFTGLARGVPPGVLTLDVVARAAIMSRALNSLTLEFGVVDSLENDVADWKKRIKKSMDQGSGSLLYVDERGAVQLREEDQTTFEIDGNDKLAVRTPMDFETKIYPGEDGAYDDSKSGDAAFELYFSLYNVYHSSPGFAEKVLVPMVDAGLPLAAPERNIYHQFLRGKAT